MSSLAAKWRWSKGQLSARVGRLVSRGRTIEAVVLELGQNLYLWCVYELDAAGHETVLQVGSLSRLEAALLVAEGRGRRLVTPPPRPRRRARVATL